MISSTCTVVKVGGALLGDDAGLMRVARAVATRRLRGERLLVVVSALKGVTDALERACLLALDPRAGNELVRDVMQRLRDQHAQVVRGLASREAVGLRLAPVLDGVERLLTGIRLTGEVTPRTRDLVMAHGERLAAPLLAAAVSEAGADARAVTAEEAGLVAVGSFRVGACDTEASAEGLAGLAHELHDRVLVLTGFYGVNTDGDVVLFGRGGTDYTAGVAAAGLAADGFELWKDVPGFMSADPVEVPGACVVTELSFDEACELGLYGARILHPRCLDPLRGMDVAVSVRPVEDVDAEGTRLVERRVQRRAAVAALAARREVAVVRVQSAAMVNEPGVAGTVLTALGEAGVNVDALASAMTSLSCSIGAEDVPLARRTLRLLAERGVAGVENVGITEGLALLGVVGDGLAAEPKACARLLACLAEHEVEVHLISHGPGDVGLSCAVPEADLQRALTALHATFFPAGERMPSDAPSERA
jgi:aspartate kinase